MAFIDRFAMSIGSQGANGLVSLDTNLLRRAAARSVQPAVEERIERTKNAHALPTPIPIPICVPLHIACITYTRATPHARSVRLSRRRHMVAPKDNK